MNGLTFPRLDVLRTVVGLPATASETPAIPVEDDPETLARLAAIMSDRVRPCPTCGGDVQVCRAIGCEVDGVRPDDEGLLNAAPALLPARAGLTTA